MSANDGQAAITRPAAVGCATATLAARLAALPATRSAQGSTEPRSPRPRVGQQRGRCRHDHPGHRPRRQRRNPPRLSMERHERVHVKAGDRPGDQGQQAHAPGRRPPDPPLPGRFMPGSQLRTLQTARIGIWVHSPLGHNLLCPDQHFHDAGRPGVRKPQVVGMGVQLPLGLAPRTHICAAYVTVLTAGTVPFRAAGSTNLIMRDPACARSWPPNCLRDRRVGRHIWTDAPSVV